MKHTTLTATDALSPSWPIRWEQARGTYSETFILMTIAAEALHRDREIWFAAYDAANATDPVERAEHIAALEALFDEANPDDGYGPADTDAGWRTSPAAETHFGGRFGA